jgi:hypothetical protein
MSQLKTGNLDKVIEYDNRRISNISYRKFVGITLGITVYWKPLIDQLLPKLSLARYAISHQTMPQETLIMVYYAYCLLNYELWYYFWE